jgi:REP element-mobilizing transposase RayT
MADCKTPLEPDRYYHIYNHAVGNEILFYNDKNYEYFLSLIEKYLTGYVDIYAYCLLPNHFHLLIKVKDLNGIDRSKVQNNKKISKEISIPKVISRQLSHLFNSYAQAINKQLSRKGSLFNNRFKRIQVTNERYFINLVQYIHHNPIEAGFVTNLSDWKFTSYNAIISDNETRIERKEILRFFGGKENFIHIHKNRPNIEPYEGL